MQAKRDRAEMTEDFLAAVDFVGNHPDSTGKSFFSFWRQYGVAACDTNTNARGGCFLLRRTSGPEETINAPLMLHHGEWHERVNASGRISKNIFFVTLTLMRITAFTMTRHRDFLIGSGVVVVAEEHRVLTRHLGLNG